MLEEAGLGMVTEGAEAVPPPRLAPQEARKRQVGLTEAEAERIAARREAIGAPAADTQPIVGLALSGGGIRSATFSLGLVQGMARAETLERVDLLSTVSGGGYTGTFLRSLFIPSGQRFPCDDPPETLAPKPGDPLDPYTRRRNWALGILKTAPSVRIQPPDLAAQDDSPLDESAEGLPGEHERTNPIWWLREHGRYLAPNGSGDYLYALAYIIRAWFALQFVTLVSLLAIFLGFKTVLAALFIQLREHSPAAACIVDYGVNLLSWPVSFEQVQAVCAANAGAHAMLGQFGFRVLDLPGFKLSPILAAPVLLWLLGILPLAMSYWQSVLISNWRDHRPRLILLMGLLLGLAFALTGAAFLPQVEAALGWGRWLGPATTAAMTAGAVLLAIAYIKSPKNNLDISRTELRRRLTTWMARIMWWAMLTLFLGLIDSIALNVVRPSAAETQSGLIAQLGVFTTIIPVIIWLTKKVQQWLPALQRLQNAAASAARALPGLLLVLGLGAYAIIATVCATLAYLIVWDQMAPWSAADLNHAPAFVSAGVISLLVLAAAIITGLSPNFLNISSLHLFYAGRLTRAYLGASNGRRLHSYNPDGEGGKSANIQDYDPGDFIGMDVYHDDRVLAPIHLINVTANMTLETGSQLVQRDRKGENLCVGPDGVSLGGRLTSWDELYDTLAEKLPVGKWMAISGAAASSGMGSSTSLGGALLTTFANVRLGYWWYAPLLGGRVRTGHGRKPTAFGGPFETQVYLLNEMSAKYSRVNKLRLNLSDGGHFENSAALELIRRRLPIIVVSDAAADPLYEFADLANLVRLARIELGAEIRLLNRGEKAAVPDAFRRHLGTPGSFRRKQARDGICAIPFRIDYPDGTPPTLLIWIKPRVPDDAPPDIATYSRQHASFPQEPTVDQFFDEAQWENYRKLGQTIGGACLDGAGLAALQGLRAAL